MCHVVRSSPAREGISNEGAIWQSREEHYLDSMILLEKIICLLSIVVAVSSEDQFDQCALVNELVEQGEVRT